MADGSREVRDDPKQLNKLTFSASNHLLGDTKKCSDETFDDDEVKLPLYTEPNTSVSCKQSVSRGSVAAVRSSATVTINSQKTSSKINIGDGDDRKKRCFDRYDSSESSDSGVAVLSPTESGGCSSSDITEPRSPRSPEWSCASGEEGARMPPWASEPAPPAPPPLPVLPLPPAPPAPPARRLPLHPAPARRPTLHRRITEYFNHKMKPQNGLKRDSSFPSNDESKRKCLPKNGVTNDLEKYISYLSKTLSPKVLMDVSKQHAEATARMSYNTANCVTSEVNDVKNTNLGKINGFINNKPKESNEKSYAAINGFVDVRHRVESSFKDKLPNGVLNGYANNKKHVRDLKLPPDPSANGVANVGKLPPSPICKIPITASDMSNGMKIAPATSTSQSPKKSTLAKTDNSRMNGVVSSTTKLDARMNGVTCGSNNLNLNPILPKMQQHTAKRELPKKNTQPKRTNRKSSACIANSKNLTWSKANNLKQVQLQKQNCINGTPMKNIPGEMNQPPKMNLPNGVRQVPMTVNGNLNNLNIPVTNYQNCHQINIGQPCNGSVASNSLPSFVAVPQNVMLTTLRIPQNGITTQTLNQQNNISAFNRSNVNVSSPTKLNGQFVFPLVQNLNGTMVQIPNLMAKMPNFVLPQTPQRQDHLQNQQAAQILINGTLLKLANTMSSPYSSMNKTVPATSQSMGGLNKNITGLQNMGMTVQPKTNYTVNLSHSVLMPQPGFFVTSVPNINVKETWSCNGTNTVSSSQSACSNPIVHHPTPIVTSFTTQALHTSSIPIAPVKPPDNPIQGTEPPSSTVKEPETFEEISSKFELKSSKCDIPWLSKTVNNNIFPLDCNMKTRPFAQVSSLSKKFEELTKEKVEYAIDEEKEQSAKENTIEELRKIEEVARREETIFTQITVLKDVSSNVQNSVIEANFCSATTESSESGIGTDKSIDSPSDSQTSKECDEDSSLSLSISVCSVDVQSCQKSPILKQPKTLRFPPRSKADSDQRTSSTDTTTTVCMWENCKREFESDTDLLEHLQAVHVETQAGKENYVCLWEQCKVRGKPSCSRLWLERHTLSHGGNKPFKCIVDGCGRRFSTQILLERHVNNHFNEVSPNASGSKKTGDSGAKLIRRNGKKLRYRRQPWSARMFDFFDSGTMEGLSWRLSRASRWRLGGACPLRDTGRHALTLHAALQATRYNAAEGRTEALLTYYPPNVIEDEWVPEKDVKRTKRVEIAQLPVQSKVTLYEQFCASYRKSPSPPPVPPPSPPTPPRLLPARQCTSSRVLNNLIAKQKKADFKEECSATNVPMIYNEEEYKTEVSGAKKRKMGRRHGGNAFWPCGR